MGNGGILWIWMTITISVVHLSPLVFDFDHMNEKSFQKLKLDLEKFSVPGLRTEIRDRFLSTLIFHQFLDIQCRFVQNWSSQPRESFSRPR